MLRILRIKLEETVLEMESWKIWNHQVVELKRREGWRILVGFILTCPEITKFYKVENVLCLKIQHGYFFVYQTRWKSGNWCLMIFTYDDGQIVVTVVQSPFVLQPFKYDLFIFDASSKVLDHAPKLAVAPPGASCRRQWCLWWHRWPGWQLRRETVQVQGCWGGIAARHQEAWQDARH